jgi:hypothetical protein
MTDLITALDAAAAALLERATAEDKNEDGTPTLVTLAERTKAFDSVVDWAKVRQGLVPPDKTPSKFEQIKGAFDGSAGKPRKRRGAAEPTEGAIAGGVDGSGIERSGSDDGLFAS